jgi:hypothetical protein
MNTSSKIRVNVALLISLGLIGCGGADTLTTDGEDNGVEITDPGASQGAAAQGVDADLSSLPVYLVKGRGLDAARADKLVAALGMDTQSLKAKGPIADADGAINYLDAERFHRIPMKTISSAAAPGTDESGFAAAPNDKAVDIEGLKAMTVLSEDEALSRAEAAFVKAGIEVRGAPTTSHSVFEGRSNDGQEIVKANIDTQVRYETRLEGLRLMGPGAKAGLVLDGEGNVTQLVHAMHDLERGEEVQIVPPSQAGDLCAQALGGGDSLEVEAELVYYAPALSQRAERIFPHYSCGGTKIVDGELVDVRRVFVPAVLDAPKATLTMNTSGANVSASAEVTGGTAPYTFAWVSSSKSIAQSSEDPSSAEYTVLGRTMKPTAETLTLYVTDANGLSAKVAETALVQPVVSKAVAEEQSLIGGSPFGTIGTEWIGTCGGLGGSAGNAGGFVSRFASSGISTAFNWGDNNAWEIDFKDASLGGQDQYYADAVDLVFYTGHANGAGFSFCSSVNDTWLDYTDARWGQTQIEWLVIAACGPLQDDGGAWVSRWQPAFQGLHLLMGYADISWDNTVEGSTLADALLRYDHHPVRLAWVESANAGQPAGVPYAYMGVYGPNWTAPNWNDYFHGMGPVGEDMVGANIWGVWRIQGNTI